MTSRERVFRALEFGSPDRPARDLWAMPSVPPDQVQSFLRDFPMDFTGPGQVLAPGDLRRGEQFRKGNYVDDWGCLWESKEDGVVGEVKGPPLADLTGLATYQPPWEILRRANWDAVKRAQDANLATGVDSKFMLAWTGIDPFERLQFLRGTENLYMDIGYGTTEFYRLLQMVHEFAMEELAGWVRTPLDGICFMDDWGSQQAMLISPVTWREIFKPLYRNYCDMIHGAGKKSFFHSDGQIIDIYEDLVELGIDAINSQVSCMDMEELGMRFRGKVTFWGEIDRQQIMAFGTTEATYEAVVQTRLALEDPRGGMIAQCVWNIDSPVENVRSVYEAWKVPLAELSHI